MSGRYVFDLPLSCIDQMAAVQAAALLVVSFWPDLSLFLARFPR